MLHVELITPEKQAFMEDADFVAAPTTEGDTALLGKLLFSQYVLPFEVVSVLLLVAMVGVILLSKKDLK